MQHLEDAPPVPRRTRRQPSWAAGLAGLLAAAAALAVAELVAGLSARLSSPVITVGNRVVDAVPRPVKDLAIEWFGTNDKVALLVGIGVLTACFGVAIGVLAGRRTAIGIVGVAAFGVVGTWAASQEVDAPWWAGAPSVVGAAAGIGVLLLLLSLLPPAARPTEGTDGTAATDHGPDALAHDRATDRRRFLLGSGAVAVLSVAVAAGGRALQQRFSAAGSRLAVVLPRATRSAPPLAPDAVLDVEGISPFITPNRDFYRIDTNLTVPQLPAEDWSLRITGMVDRELELTYNDILAMDLVEERITMTCVSNEVGGGLVGTATWLGVRLDELLDRAGIDPGADQIVGRAFDGFTTGFPVATLDGRPALLAVGMNGEPLPLAHGFPARIVVPGLYGYVSATKWLTEIELTTFDRFDQYWVERDWSARGPIKTMARIDTPRGLQKLPAGRVRIGGVAWAQTRGIERVEVQVDGGPWEEAMLAAEDSTLTWRQWVVELDVAPGRHQVVCRATDGTGEVQTDERARPFPDGASGWHSVAFIVE